MKLKKVKGFSLQNVLIGMIVTAILFLLAQPNLTKPVTRAKTMEAQLQLNHLCDMEKLYYYANSKYSADFNEIDFEQSKLKTEDGTANYRIEIIEASDKGFTATATAVVDFDGDGSYNVWQITQDKNLKEITQD